MLITFTLFTQVFKKLPPLQHVSLKEKLYQPMKTEVKPEPCFYFF
jgi:hypothetical protein